MSRPDTALLRGDARSRGLRTYHSLTRLPRFLSDPAWLESRPT